MAEFRRDLQYWKFSLYGFVKNLQFFDPFLVLFFREMGISFFEIGVLYAVRELATNLTEIPTGVIADTLGRRSAMLFAFASYIVSYLLFYFLPSYPVYLGAMIAFALGESFRSGTHKAMIMEYLRQNGMSDQKVAYYGHTRSWAQKGSALSALVAGGLVFLSGSYRVVFLWSIIPYLGGMLLILSYPRELDFSCDEEDCGDTNAKRGLKEARETIRNFVALLRDSSVRRGLFNTSLFDALFKTVKDYVQPILKGLALSLPLLTILEGNQRVALISGLVYFLLYLMTSAASSRSSRFHNLFPDKISGLNLTYLAGAVTVAAIGFLLMGDLKIAAVVLFVVYYLLENLRRPAAIGFLSDRIKGSVMATGLSGESQLKTLLVAGFSPLFGLAADKFGLSMAMLLLSIIPVVSYPWLRFRTQVRE